MVHSKIVELLDQLNRETITDSLTKKKTR